MCSDWNQTCNLLVNEITLQWTEPRQPGQPLFVMLSSHLHVRVTLKFNIFHGLFSTFLFWVLSTIQHLVFSWTSFNFYYLMHSQLMSCSLRTNTRASHNLREPGFAHTHQGWAKVGLQLWVCRTQEFILILLFINYCIIFHANNCKPTSAHHICCIKLVEWSEDTSRCAPMSRTW